MSESYGKLREIAWNEVCPWLLLVRCIRIALLVRVLLLGAIGLVAVTGGWRAITSLFADVNDPVIQEWREEGCQWVWQKSSPFTISAVPPPHTAADVLRAAVDGIVDAPLQLWSHFTRPFIDLFHAELTLTGFGCLVLCGLWEIFVWALVGGAITRIAALALTRGEAPDLGQAARFSGGLLFSYCAAPLMALAAASVFAIQLIIFGFAMRVDALAMLAGIAWPFVLLLGLLMAIILIGLLIGWPFMWATLSVEGTDAFDAVSRSYAYTYQRPLRLVWYILFAGLLGGLGLFAVKFFALATIALGDWSIGWGLEDPRMHGLVVLDPMGVEQDAEQLSNGMLETARGGIVFWKSLLEAVAAGYQAGYLWTASVGIYLLLRRDIDAAEINEIFIDDEEPDFGMPPLEEDETGVPEVAPHQPAEEADTGGE